MIMDGAETVSVEQDMPKGGSRLAFIPFDYFLLGSNLERHRRRAQSREKINSGGRKVAEKKKQSRSKSSLRHEPDNIGKAFFGSMGLTDALIIDEQI